VSGQELLQCSHCYLLWPILGETCNLQYHSMLNFGSSMHCHLPRVTIEDSHLPLLDHDLLQVWVQRT